MSYPLHIRGLNLVITVPADDLAPIGARPSAGTVLTKKLDMLSFKLRCLPIIPVTSSKIATEISHNLAALRALTNSWVPSPCAAITPILLTYFVASVPRARTLTAGVIETMASNTASSCEIFVDGVSAFKGDQIFFMQCVPSEELCMHKYNDRP